MTAGAYGAVQAGTYNTRPLVAEVMVNGDRLRRDTAAPGRRPDRCPRPVARLDVIDPVSGFACGRGFPGGQPQCRDHAEKPLLRAPRQNVCFRMLFVCEDRFIPDRENRLTDASHLPDAARPRHVAGAMLITALKKARWITFWERLWPHLPPIATAVGLFLAVSWAGAVAVAAADRARGRLFIFLVLTAAATVPLIFGPLPLAHRRAAPPRPRWPALPIARPPPSPTSWRRPKSDPWSVALVARPCGARAAGGQEPQGGTAGAAPRPARSHGAAGPGPDPGGHDLHRRRRRTRPAHRRGIRLAGRGRAGEFPPRCLGVAADLYGAAAGDPAGHCGRANAPRLPSRPSRCRAGSVLVVRASGKVQFDVVDRRRGRRSSAPSSVPRRPPGPRNGATSSPIAAPRSCVA